MMRSKSNSNEDEDESEEEDYSEDDFLQYSNDPITI